MLGTGYKNATAQVLRRTSLLLPWDVLERTKAGKEDGAEAAAMHKEKNTSGRPFLPLAMKIGAQPNPKIRVVVSRRAVPVLLNH